MKTGGDPDGLDVGKECALSIPKQLTDSLRADSEQRVAQEDQPDSERDFAKRVHR
jgi:hypothetical protein